MCTNKPFFVCSTQVWYDDPESLSAKYAIARRAGFRGVGPYMYSFLDFSEAEPAKRQTKAMWDALRQFTEG